MFDLNYLTMLSAIRTASEIPNIKIGIYLPTMSRCRSTYEEIVDELLWDKEINHLVDDFIEKSDMYGILFKNKSKIEVIPARENQRGRRYDSVLCDADVDKNLKNLVVKHTERIRGNLRNEY